jgi:hypothetical protein
MQAGGVGINLIGANRAILFEVNMNPAIDVQAIFRCFRFGQTRPVSIYRLVAEGCVEENLYVMATMKQMLALRVIDQEPLTRWFTRRSVEDLLCLTASSAALPGDNTQKTMRIPEHKHESWMKEITRVLPHLAPGLLLSARHLESGGLLDMRGVSASPAPSVPGSNHVVLDDDEMVDMLERHAREDDDGDDDDELDPLRPMETDEVAADAAEASDPTKMRETIDALSAKVGIIYRSIEETPKVLGHEMLESIKYISFFVGSQRAVSLLYSFHASFFCCVSARMSVCFLVGLTHFALTLRSGLCADGGFSNSGRALDHALPHF